MNRTLTAVAAAGLMLAVPLLAEDTRPTALPDATGYAAAGDLIAEVVKADDDGLTVRVEWPVPSAGRSRTRHHSPWHAHAGTARTPLQMEQHLLALRRQLGGGRAVKGKEHHADYDFKYLSGGLARLKHLPKKIAADGTTASHTQAEIDAARKPDGAPGWAADRSAVHPGSVVELHLVRPKAVAADKATAADLSIKYAVLLGDAAHPPKPDAKDKK